MLQDRTATRFDVHRSPLRVLIVDDHELFADAIRPILEAEGFAIAGISTTGRDGIQEARRTTPDVILLDLGLPDDAVWTGMRMLEDLPDVKVLVLAPGENGHNLREALDAPFHGYLTKNVPAAHLVAGIRSISAGVPISDDGLRRGIIDSPIDHRDAAELTRKLSVREREVLAMLVEGADTEEIARRLYISTGTVRTHVQRILGKLGVHSRLQAVAFVVGHKVEPTTDKGHRSP